MSRTRSSDRDETGRDAGLTLVEMVVTMAIGSLLLTLVTAFVVNQVRSIDYANKRNTASIDMANAQDFVGKRLRTMVVGQVWDPSSKLIGGPTVADDKTLSFFSLVTATGDTANATTAPPVQETYLWADKQADGTWRLCETSQLRARNSGDPTELAAIGSTNSDGTKSKDLSLATNRTCHALVNNLVEPTTAAPLFEYLAKDYDPLSGSPKATDVVANPAVDPSLLRAVRVNLNVNGGTGLHPVVLENASVSSLMNKVR